MALTRVTTPVISTTTTGNSGQVLTAGTDGNLVWLNQAALAVAGANVTGTVANATFATSAGTANSATVASSANSVAGANVTGTVANATFATSAGTANSATVASSANSVAGANVTGTVANATFATSAGTANTANSATVAGSANSVAGANVTGTVANATFATSAGTANTANSVTLANVTGIGNIANINLNGNGSQALLGNGAWGNVSSGGSITDWSLASSYSSGAIVVYNNGIYQSNDTISANTAFVLGSTGATWKQLSSAGTVAPEFGQTIIPEQSTAALSNGTLTDLTGASFTLPSAGTWEVTYNVEFNNSQGTIFAITNDSNTLVDESMSVTQAGIFTAIRTVRITTTGSETFKLRIAGYNGGVVAIKNNTNTAQASYPAGESLITWKKISGFIPANGATTAILKATRTAVQSITSGVGINVAVVCNSIENQGGTGVTYNSTTGTVTLTAGNTYRLRGAVGSVISTLVGQAASIQFQWRNTTTGAFVGGTGSQIAPGASNTNTIGVPVAEAVITPNVTTTLQLWVTNLYNATGIGQQTTGAESGFPWIDIEQLGTTNTSAFTGMISNSYDVNNTYPSGTIVVKDGFLYQANSTIVAGTAFAVGTTGATWTLLNLQAAEYGESVPASSVSVPASNVTAQTVDVVSFTLPTAGVWEVTYSLRGGVSTNTAFMNGLITDNSNNSVANSASLVSYINATTLSAISYQGTATQTVRITTATTNTVYKLRARVSGDTSVSTVYGASDPFGMTKVVWKKISGFLPLQPKVFTETITIGATTTAPAKATTKVLDYITLTDDGSGWCDVEMAYVHSNATGSAAGSGTYLFTLPAGYAFDTSVQPLNTQATQLAGDGEAYKMIPAVGLTQTVSTYSLNSNYAVPYTATQFRIIPMNPSNWFFIGSGYYAITGSNITYKISFRFKKA